MNRNSLIEYLDRVRPATPQEVITGTYGWTQSQIQQMFADACQWIFKQFVDELEKWLRS